MMDAVDDRDRQRPVPKPRRSLGQNVHPLAMTHGAALNHCDVAAAEMGRDLCDQGSTNGPHDLQVGFKTEPSPNQYTVPPSTSPPSPHLYPPLTPPFYDALPLLTPMRPPPPLPPRPQLSLQLPTPAVAATEELASARNGSLSSAASSHSSTTISPADSRQNYYTPPPSASDMECPDHQLYRASGMLPETPLLTPSVCDGGGDSPLLRFSHLTLDAPDIPRCTPEPRPQSVERGEKISFCGWVQLLSPHVAASSHHRDSVRGGGRRCWGEIRDQRLAFKENDESPTTIAHSPIEMHLCEYVGRSRERAEEVILLFREIGKARRNGTHKTTLRSVRFVSESAANAWLLLLSKSVYPQTETLRSSLIAVDTGGQLWIKQGISGGWAQGWGHTHNRRLSLWLSSFDAVIEVDLRKVVSLGQETEKPEWLESGQAGPVVIVQAQGGSLYLQSSHDLCTTMWLNELKADLKTAPGCRLEENRLTSEDVPVIVSECIKWVTIYAINQQGIYRRNGSTAEVRRLFGAFIEDPYKVSLKSNGEESMNAVADVLRQFFRQLEAPLIPIAVQGDLFGIAELDEPQKLDAYRQLFNNLQPVHRVYYCTLRKLLAHLQQITFHSDRNLASMENIARVFAMTLFSVDNMNKDASAEMYSQSTRQSLVLADLLTHYDYIFQISKEEQSVAQKFEKLQEKTTSSTSKSNALGFLVPVHLNEKGNQCFNVQSEWTAHRVLEFQRDRLICPPISAEPSSGSNGVAFSELGDRYALFEVIHDGRLERRMGADETLTSVMLDRWLLWGINKSDESYLLMKKDLESFVLGDVHPFTGDSGVKMAGPGSRSFRGVQLRIDAGKVVQYSKKKYKMYKTAEADPKMPKKLVSKLRELAERAENEWDLDTLLWFKGHDAERKAPHPHCLTFFLLPHPVKESTTRGASFKRRDSKEKKDAQNQQHGKLPGFCLSFKEEDARDGWLNSLAVLRHEFLSVPLLEL